MPSRESLQRLNSIVIDFDKFTDILDHWFKTCKDNGEEPFGIAMGMMMSTEAILGIDNEFEKLLSYCERAFLLCHFVKKYNQPLRFLGLIKHRSKKEWLISHDILRVFCEIKFNPGHFITMKGFQKKLKEIRARDLN